MKKVKLNLDKQAIGQFFVQHIEKLVFAGAVAGSLLIVLKALMGGDTYDKTPDDLIRESRRAEEHIKRTEPPEIQSVVSAVNLDPFPEKPYLHDTPWWPRLFEALELRDAPPVLPIEGVRAIAGFGPFEFKATRVATDPTAGNAGANEQPGARAQRTVRGQRWVVLTGKVPFGKQTRAQQACFENTVSTDSTDVKQDAVAYLGYFVERAEITSQADIDKPRWTQQFNSLDAVQEATSQWRSPGRPIVDSRFVDTETVFPLGPLVDREWGLEVAYPPDIPIGRVKTPVSPKPQPEKSEDPDEEEPTDVFDQAGGRPQGPRPGLAVGETSEDEIVEYKLFRFFDFSVAPGKQYCYRVRLVLKNPNWNVKEKFLKDPSLNDSRYVPSDWTDHKSTVVAVPNDTKVLALSVTPPPASRVDDEPKAKVGVIKWVVENGAEVAAEFSSIMRGKVINFPKVPFQSIEVDCLTEAIALDMRGGGRLSGDVRLTEPGEILLLSADGTLVVHRELSDLAEYEKRRTGGATEPAKGGGDLPGDGGEDDLGKQLGALGN